MKFKYDNGLSEADIAKATYTPRRDEFGFLKATPK